MSEFFPKPYERANRNIKVESDLSNYAKRQILQKNRGVDTSHLASKSDLASLKAEVAYLDMGKLKIKVN